MGNDVQIFQVNIRLIEPVKKDQSVGTPSEQVERLTLLDHRVVATGGDQQLVAGLCEPTLQRINCLGEDRIVNCREYCANRARPARLQGACAGMRHVTQLCDCDFDFMPQLRAHGVGRIDDAGHRSRRHFRLAGNVKNVWQRRGGRFHDELDYTCSRDPRRHRVNSHLVSYEMKPTIGVLCLDDAYLHVRGFALTSSAAPALDSDRVWLDTENVFTFA